MKEFNNSRASHEGWGLFNGNQIQRDDESGRFRSDAAARAYVAKRARMGSAYHKDALERASAREYKIDVGNSSTGPVGFVAYITAPNKRAALRQFKENMPDQIRATDWSGGEVNVYLNANAVTLKDVQLCD
jgi:hypothetical protein